MLSAPLAPLPASGLLYLHGFNSGYGSPKAALIRAACTELALPCETPQLPHRPAAALEMAEAQLNTLGPSPLLVGSSLGGFLVTCLAERHDLPAVLVNPAVRPARLVGEWVGEAFVNEHTDERFVIEAAHREELVELTPQRVCPERYLLLLGTADETLDPADAFALYRGARTVLHPGGDHVFGMLESYLPAVLAHGGHCLPPRRVTAGPPGQ
ncbi:esterase [Halomonas sp. MCCC 1A17488]|uniref:YqiA/YcfP family alpha/beta fold hydrolase n=1 Tax=unclassified Halomonas TaxID=2609666 RepID=UPI0018D24CA1|nr:MULTISPECIES: YqiA/YcfP family alpha/beta fold hydrolase [unclassified Halomonas]MCE8018205.1 esterase [Halomonas sp. MCCC 1A17488]MCG3241538.1 esterase [Halomonas sp. MCCC 1A17488]QPP48510.1 esterase [Halomonas sp. SS10-MC5]